MKTIKTIIKTAPSHWVGNGFPVKTLFSYHQNAAQFSPFLLLDYAGPMNFPGDGVKRGVGEHPHRGFETVTLVYQGGVAHRDSAGNGGVIGPGEVQWMTAGSGLMHEEFHSPQFGSQGGDLQMVQLWVNLPRDLKMTAPKYQSITRDDIPELELANNAGKLRLIAGQYADAVGPAQTHTPVSVYDLRLNAGGEVSLDIPVGWTSVVLVLNGAVTVNGDSLVTEAQLALLSRENSGVTLAAQEKSTVLVLAGEPIHDPIVGHGPFVMNSKQEIMQAFDDLRTGRFGRL